MINRYAISVAIAGYKCCQWFSDSKGVPSGSCIVTLIRGC